MMRLVVGAILFYYGSQKLLGWFGGYGFNATLDAFHDKNHIPAWLGALAIFGEFFGGLGMLLGLFSRLAAFGASCTMAVATVITSRGVTSLVATSAQNPVRDIGFPLALFAISMAILLMGAGSFSLDSKLFRKRK